MSARRRTRIALAGASLLVALLLAEVALRVRAWRADRRELLDAIRVEVPIPADRRVALGHIVRVVDDDDLIYELRPDVADVQYEGGRVTTSSLGLRGPELAREKPEGFARIVGIGDSVMFGQGVDDGLEYPRLVERRLAAAGVPCEFVNLAVPGYNTAMEVESLRAKGLALGPDLVVIGFVSNDLDLPIFVRNRRPVLSLSRSFLLDALRRRLDEDDAADAPVGLVPRPKQRRDVPEAWRHLVGWDAVLGGLDDLAALAAEHDFPVVFFSHRGTEVSRRAAREAEERGFVVVELEPVVRAWMQEHGVQTYAGSPLTVGPDDPHPSALQHGLAAEALVEAILGNELIPR